MFCLLEIHLSSFCMSLRYSKVSASPNANADFLSFFFNIIKTWIIILLKVIKTAITYFQLFTSVTSILLDVGRFGESCFPLSMR